MRWSMMLMMSTMVEEEDVVANSIDFASANARSFSHTRIWQQSLPDQDSSNLSKD